MNKLIWAFWLILSATIAGYYAYTLQYAEDKSEFLIGEATHGHFQIEMACSACHSEAFGGEDVLQNACTTCHADELKQAHDSHPKKKFNDPRNADTLEVLDARYCISCHTEHQKEQTLDMGVTLPKDYCYHCHQDVGNNRPSHKDLAFDSCANAGCHNYHDNRALYEKFLIKNADQPWLQDIARIAEASATHIAAEKAEQQSGLPDQFDLVAHQQRHPEITKHWQASSHMNAGVDCAGCHQTNSIDDTRWITNPSIKQCENCHSPEAKGFKAGKHGMRLAQQMSAITPADSNLDFHEQTAHQQQSCASCHGAHEFNSEYAATEACLDCHNDVHSLAFKASKHGQLVSNEDLSHEETVSCATCHMPRLEKTISGEKTMAVEHNQNRFLRPNEKMIRPVCMQCHSLEFSIDALADTTLIQNNFNGLPGKHIPSIDWAKQRKQD